MIFLRYYHSKLSFSAGLRNCLSKWYDQRSPTELLELIFASPKYDHVRHIDIIKLIRPQLENPDKKDIIKAAFMSYKEIQDGAKKSTTLKKILKYRDLKKCQKAHEVVSILKRKDFVYKINHLPTFALKHAEIVELILPNLSLEEILGCLRYFYVKGLLKSDNSVSRKICNALKFNKKTIQEMNLTALHVFGIMKTLEFYLEPRKKSGLVTPETNTFINAKLMSIINALFNERAKTGCRYYVTFDLRKFSKNRKLKKSCLLIIQI